MDFIVRSFWRKASWPCLAYAQLRTPYCDVRNLRVDLAERSRPGALSGHPIPSRFWGWGQKGGTFLLAWRRGLYGRHVASPTAPPLVPLIPTARGRWAFLEYDRTEYLRIAEPNPRERVLFYFCSIRREGRPLGRDRTPSEGGSTGMRNGATLIRAEQSSKA